MNAVRAPWKVVQADATEPNTTRPHGARLLWTDPPYGTGKRQTGARSAYKDHSETDYVIRGITAWLPILALDATVVVCCDYRLAPRLTVGVTDSGWVYRGEIIWEFGLGRPRSSWWPVRHNNILTFTRTLESGLFDSTAIPRARRLAPKPGYSSDKPAGSVWDFTLSNTDSERVGYPNQKSLRLIEPFVLAHTLPGDLVVDPFCGSSSTGVAAIRNGRKYYGVDINPDAITVSKEILGSEGLK